MKYTYDYVCPKCDRFGLSTRQKYTLLITDAENNFKIKCKRGHQKTIVYEDEKYSMLFASAMECIKEGNLREAITNIASSYERLLEYAIKIICIHKKIQSDDFDIAWKNLKSHSERQLGAFCMLYLMTFNKMPPVFKEKSVQFRNSVIHKGAYPTYSETTEFAVAAFELMIEILYNLNLNCNKAIIKHLKNTRLELEKKRLPNGILSLIRVGSFLDFDYSNGKPSAITMNRNFERWKSEFSNVSI